MDVCAFSDAKADENIEGTQSSSSIFAPAADGAVFVWKQLKICLDIACFCVAKQTVKQNANKLYTLFEFSVTEHWRNIAKYIGLENTTLGTFYLDSPKRLRRGCTVLPLHQPCDV